MENPLASIVDLKEPTKSIIYIQSPKHARVFWKETPDGHVIMLDMSRMKKDKIKIEVEGNKFKVLDNVDLDSIKDKLENEILTLTFNKLSPNKINKPRVINIVGDYEQPPKLKGSVAR
ncbi:hypothetical protein VNO77_23286 [Canavalia gladiata]|uniref:Uncharacterized protein n=1 Tax=Canavalia gladiata TaxID=3824 RepID=A0AAN9L461_CANGL